MYKIHCEKFVKFLAQDWVLVGCENLNRSFWDEDAAEEMDSWLFRKAPIVVSAHWILANSYNDFISLQKSSGRSFCEVSGGRLSVKM